MQNTPELLQYSMDVRKTCESAEDHRKGIYFEAMLAMNLNQLEHALVLADDDDILANNIKLLAMSKLNDWTGVCDLLYKIKTNRLHGERFRVYTEVVSTHTPTNTQTLYKLHKHYFLANGIIQSKLQRIKQSLDLAKPNLTSQEYTRCHRFIQEFVYLGRLVLRAAVRFVNVSFLLVLMVKK